MNQKRLILAGGSGFIGRALAQEFSARGYAVVVLTRSPRQREDGVRETAWDGVHPGAWTMLLEGADAIINLAGKNINCPHTPENLRAITTSRVDSVQAIATALDQAKLPPKVWVQASAVGFYGDTADAICDESAPVGNDPLANVCRQWEATFASASLPRTRKVTLRIGFVLGRDGGALPVLCKLTQYFLGGAAGSGRQYISWIHLADLVAMFVAAVEDEKLSGTFNAVGPQAVTNGQFMRELRRVLHRPWSPPAPGLAVKLGARLLGSEASLALVSQRCAPKRFLAGGFKFQFADITSALSDLCKMTIER
jgi:uncharacterized protein (TIGR01777 family)